MKKIFSAALVISINFYSLFGQIQSTTIGGLWNDPNTWIGNIVPGAANDVIIQGPVVHASASGYTILTEYCNNLTITSSGSLRNGDYGGGSGVFPLIVYGHVVNNGIVENGPSDAIKIFLNGDLENNNIWMPYETEIQGSSNHNLSLADGKSIGSKIIVSSQTLTAMTDLYFTCDWFSGGVIQRDNLYLNGHTLVLGNHSIRLYHSSVFNKGKLQGDFEILGTFTAGWADGYEIRDTLLFEGNITVTDTLKGNSYGGGYGIYKLRVNGNLTNNGVIKDDTDADEILNADDLELLITGNIVNNGIWSCNYNTLIGSGPQTIFQSAGKIFDGYFTYLGTSPELICQSDLAVTKDFTLNNVKLEMNNHVLNVNRWLTNGKINNCVLYDGFLQNINSVDNLTITGKVTVDNNNVFNGSVFVQDTLQSNEYGGGSTIFTLTVNGDITNYGVIKNINSGDMLSLEISGNINNSGVWQNSFTKFAGAQDQNISQSADRIFITELSDLDSTSKVIATSDLKVEGNFNLNRSTLQMDNHEIDITGHLYNGNILSPKIKNATISDLNAYDSIEVRGVVVVDDGNCFYGNLIVTDTLQSQVYGGGAHTYILKNFGYVLNYGLIRNEPTQNENLALQIQGSITNKGEWTNYRTYQLFYPNDSINSVTCFNTGTTNCLFNGSTITGSGANSYSIFSGGGVQNVAPNESYDLSVEFNPTGGDTTAVLNIECNEIGTLNNIYLIGYNYNSTVDIEEEIQTFVPAEFTLFQNYPNPFNPTTTIRYTVVDANYASGVPVRLVVYDVLGNEVITLVNENKPAGHYKVQFNAEGLSSGVYFYRLTAGSFSDTKKLMLVK